MIRQLLTSRTGEITNQDQLQHALALEGVIVAQPTLSRDLREIGVLKGPRGYLLQSQQDSTSSRKHQTVTQPLKTQQLPHALQRSVRTYVTQIDQGESLVVVRTTPAAAQTVASDFDHAQLDGIIGTVAGDDTIFLACRSTPDATRVRTTLASAVGMTSPSRATATA